MYNHRVSTKKIEPEKYNPLKIEPKWQKIWDKEKVYSPNLDTAKKPFYNLMMFPYPSAEGMHVGNMYAFTGSDIYGRFKRMQGYDVFEPMGLDGFGIHSENYAIKVGRHPKEQAKISEENFYRQLRATGNGFDWSRKVETYDPEYYKWTQWIFIQLFKKGLAYRKKAAVNFCPKDKTVLADEQVIDGKCERCGSIVEKRDLEQWFFKITDYAERLLNNIPGLNWSEKVKVSQKQWIGKSEGVTYRFKVKDLDIYFEMFDSVPQTFMAQTFTVIAPEHSKVHDLVKGTQHEKPVMDFIEKIKKKKIAKQFDIDKETEGVFTGRYIEYKPTGKLIPIWVASFVIAEYGSGVVNSSAHDERDFAFAKKYDIPLHPVMFPEDPKEAEKVKNLEYCYHHASDGILEEPAQFKGRRWAEVREDIINYIEEKGFGKKSAQYHLRDWLISRQRYWGPPIPMIFCPACAKASAGKENAGWQAVPEKDLPVLLPDVEDWRPEGTGTSPLANHPEFYKTTCPNCGGEARRETDVSDTFLDSSWYFFRYISTDDLTCPWKPERAKKWLPVTMYIGGAEHSVLHLLYSRFLTMVFNDLGLISHFEEPFTRFYAHGLLIKEGAKMSKSKGNVVIPDAYIKKYGADTLRAYLMFAGPFNLGGDFQDTGIEGMHRFLKRAWTLVTLAGPNGASVAGSSLMDKTIKKVTEDLENLRYNTAIASLMEYYNSLSKQKEVSKEEIEVFLKLLAPFAPHMTEELWQTLNKASVADKNFLGPAIRLSSSENFISSLSFKSIHKEPWPEYDPKMLEEGEVTMAVQINGKTRDILRLSSGEAQNLVEKKAKESEKVKKHLEGKKIKKTIYVEGKIINFVTE